MVAQNTTPTKVEFDPAEFVTELHAQGQMPQNSGGDPAVPDSAFPDDPAYDTVRA
ncbi:hypothetical protein [Streptomyces sp. BH104]|uniref:hypothetical protein n=1 Tax=Streptomyces sp. BH104 TaxID=3410407 RepID=UPI003BB5C272